MGEKQKGRDHSMKKGVRLRRGGEGVAVVTAALVSGPNVMVGCAACVQNSAENQPDCDFLPTAYHFGIQMRPA